MALVKLKQLLNGRYGKGLEIRQLMDLSKLKMGADPVIQGHDLYIPIVVHDQHLGTAVIPHGWELCESKKKDVVQLVRMVLEPELYREFLERREMNLRSIESLDISDENLALLGDDTHKESEDRVEEKPLITSILHLQGANETLIQKIAMQIHEFSARWAFVTFEDICGELQGPLDISNLGGMTLFVRNVETLTERQQNLLADYLQSPRSLAEPLIITGSTLPIDKLTSSLVNSSLSTDLQNSYLEVERAPLHSQALRELLDLFFHKEGDQDFH